MNRTHDPQHEAPELGPQLQAAVWSVLSEPVPADAVARVQTRAAALGPASVSEPVIIPAVQSTNSAAFGVHEPEQTFPSAVRQPFLSRSFLMKSLSTAAALVIVAGATLLLQSSPSAYGEVIKQLREARSFSYVKHIDVEGKTEPIQVKIMVAEDGRQRQEMAGGTVSIMDSSPRIRLTLITSSKTAIVNEPQAIPPGSPRNHPVQWLDDLKTHGDKPDKHLGKKMLDGRSVEGFVVMQSQYAYTVWIDNQTKELVQVEHEMPVKGSSITKVVMTNFRFNEKLDESLFSYDVPKGYKTINQPRLDIPKTAGGETSIVEALRGFTKQSAGKFPKSITDWGEFVILISKGSKDGQFDKEAKEAIIHLGSIIPFLTALPKDDYEYLGSGKSVDDDRCIVFWYRNKDAKFRAIFNDLTVSDIDEKDVR